MDIQSSALNHPFELFPVYIPGWKTPVLPENLAHGGIPQRIYDGRPQGLQCVIDPLTDLKSGPWAMAAFDQVDLYVNGGPAPVTGHTIQPGEESEYISLDLPHGELRNGVNRLHYRVTRVSGNFDDSAELNVLYHLRAPGDPSASMILTIPPEVIEAGVGPEEAARGVEFGFTYPYRRNYDHISFVIGLATDPFDVPDVPTPVVRTAGTEIFQQAGDNPRAEVVFIVTDQLGNTNTSSTWYLDIHLDRLEIPAITLVTDSKGVDIPNDGETIDTNVTLTGTAKANELVEVFDGAISKGSASVNGSGVWTLAIIGLTVTPHSFTATGRYGSQPQSPAYSFTVKEPLDFGQDHNQPITDFFMAIAKPMNRPPAKATYTRIATGGFPPYSYSSNSEVALVDSETGLVRAAGNGSARITATDSRDYSASYMITFSGVQLVRRQDGMWWDPNAGPSWPGGVCLTKEEMEIFWSDYYYSEGPVATALGWPETHYWTASNIAGEPYAWAFNLTSNSPGTSRFLRTHGETILPGVRRA